MSIVWILCWPDMVQMLLVSRDILLLQGEDEASEEQQVICGPKLWIQEEVVVATLCNPVSDSLSLFSCEKCPHDYWKLLFFFNLGW